MNSAYLSAAGVVCHAGRGLDALYNGMLQPVVSPYRQTLDEITPAVTVAWLPAPLPTTNDRVMALVDSAVADALAPFSAAECERMALFIASSTVDLAGGEPTYAAAVGRGETVLAWDKPGAGLLAARVARRFGLSGAQFLINTACSSGVQAFMYAAAAIRRGDCERALVVGVESPGRVTLAGFNSLLLMTPTHCRPFDRDRNGMMLGEAAAAVVLDAQPNGPMFRGMRLPGFATACNPRSVSQTDAATVSGLMRAAMRNAGVASVDAVKAHGTGTPGNDRAEAQGIAQCIDTAHTPVTAAKAALGHTLGACGVLETLAMAVCWGRGQLPPTTGFETADPELSLTPLTQAQALEPGRMLLNYFGFGGHNGVLVLERMI